MSELNINTREGQDQLKRMGVKPLPLADDLTRPYWTAARAHLLSLQHCQSCRVAIHPPREKCPQCRGSQFQWQEEPKKGSVYSFIVDHRLMVPGFTEPYIVVQVVPDGCNEDLVRIVGNLRDCRLDQVAIGMSVEAIFEDGPEITLPQFKPA